MKVALNDSDNEELLNSKNLSKYIKARMIDNDIYYIILDEIQLVPNFEGVLNDLLRKMNIDIYVTGSNSKFYLRILLRNLEAVVKLLGYMRFLIMSLCQYMTKIN